MDLFQCQANEFEDEKKAGKVDKDSVLAFIIFHIGCFVPTETSDGQRKFAKSKKLVPPEESTPDGSKICGNYILTAQ